MLDRAHCEASGNPGNVGSVCSQNRFSCTISKKCSNLFNHKVQIMNNETFFLHEKRRKGADVRREGGKKEENMFLWRLFFICLILTRFLLSLFKVSVSQTLH